MNDKQEDAHLLLHNTTSHIQFLHRHSGSVAERLLCDREVAGWIPCPVISKTLKMVLAAVLLGAQH